MLTRARELRRLQTPAERLLWKSLRSRQTENLKFRRQHPVDNFIIDFYCMEAKLAIEIDGDTHAEQELYDAARTKKLEVHGLLVIRFTNHDVMTNLEGVVIRILEIIAQRIPGFSLE